MTVRCAECAGATVWDDDAGSAICVVCGTLTDPSQSILTSHLDFPAASNHSDGIWDPAAATTLKSNRHNGNNWDLAGQGKEARDRKNAYAMSDFIKSLAVSMHASGLSPRALTLFNQAKVASHFRWGRKAKLVAGTCLSIALRESNRPDSLKDIAFLLDEPLSSLSRTFSSVTSLLKLKLTAADPAVHITTLQTHLASSIGDNRQEIGLPAPLVKSLKTLCLRSVASTAGSLTGLLTRLGPENPVGQLPVPPIACAIFMLSLEAENRSALKNLGELARCLGARCHASSKVVMERYKVIQDEIASWIEKVPWLDKYESKNGRAKVSKRDVVARGLKDVLRFREELWKKTVKSELALEKDSDDESVAKRAPGDSSETQNSGPVRPHKRRKIHHSVQDATRFLLDPLSGPIPTTLFKFPLHKSRSEESSTTSSEPPAPPSISQLPLTSYLLTAPSISLYTQRLPTRLQLLAVDRGGSDTQQIEDEELFEDGELDALMRSEEEMQTMKQVLGWDEDDADKKALPLVQKKKWKRRGSKVDPASTQSRMDMEALARFLEDPAEPDGDHAQFLGLEQLGDYKDDDGDDYSLGDDKDDDKDAYALGDGLLGFDSYVHHDGEGYGSDGDVSVYGAQVSGVSQDAGEVVVNEWRPMSPEEGASYDADNRYDEEYD